MKALLFNQHTGKFEDVELNTLKEMQEAVGGGLIEPYEIHNQIVLVFNEEGLLRGMYPSVLNEKNQLRFVGPFFITKTSYATGKFINITPKIRKWVDSLKTIQYHRVDTKENLYAVQIPQINIEGYEHE